MTCHLILQDKHYRNNHHLISMNQNKTIKKLEHSHKNNS